MRAGPLRHRVALQSPAESRAPDGGVSLTWTTYATRWASIAPITAREFREQDATQSSVTHRIILRHLAGVLARHRVVFGSRTFEIEAAPRNIQERGIMLELLAREVTD